MNFYGCLFSTRKNIAAAYANLLASTNTWRVILLFLSPKIHRGTSISWRRCSCFTHFSNSVAVSSEASLSYPTSLLQSSYSMSFGYSKTGQTQPNESKILCVTDKILRFVTDPFKTSAKFALINKESFSWFHKTAKIVLVSLTLLVCDDSQPRRSKPAWCIILTDFVWKYALFSFDSTLVIQLSK